MKEIRALVREKLFELNLRNLPDQVKKNWEVFQTLRLGDFVEVKRRFLVPSTDSSEQKKARETIFRGYFISKTSSPFHPFLATFTLWQSYRDLKISRQFFPNAPEIVSIVVIKKNKRRNVNRRIKFKLKELK